MTDRDEMIERAKANKLSWRESLDDFRTSNERIADFTLAEIARAESDLRAKIVAEIEAVKAKCPWTDGEIAYDRSIEIVRGESKES